MKSTVETLSPTRVRLEIEVPFAELEPSLKKAYREISSQVNIPGFRRGKVPAVVIDQRVGRGTVLTEAVQDIIPTQLLAAVREHDVKTLGRPDVEIKDFADGQALKFTAEVDVRPQITLPDLSAIEVTVNAAKVTDDEVDEQVNSLRERFATLKTVERAPGIGDYVQIDLVATVNGEEVPGGTASNYSYEVGDGHLVPGLDDALQGLSAGESTTFTTELVGDLAGKEGNVAVTVRTVKEKQLPDLDDSFASLASEFDTLDELRDDLRARLTRAKRVAQLYTARDAALKAVIAATGVPTPESVVRDEVKSRKETMSEQLQRSGSSMQDYLEHEGRTEDEMNAELTEAAAESVRVQLLLDALADAENVGVTDDEFGHEIIHRANRTGRDPEQYYNQLQESGLAAAVYGEMRRRKALGLVMERVKIADSDGALLTLNELRAAVLDNSEDHDRGDDKDHDLG